MQDPDKRYNYQDIGYIALMKGKSLDFKQFFRQVWPLIACPLGEICAWVTPFGDMAIQTSSFGSYFDLFFVETLDGVGFLSEV